MRVLVLSDTHLRADTLDRLPDEVWGMADRADVVLHAGDVCDQAVLDALAEDVAGGPLLVNPGSPTQRRRQPVHTVAWLEVAGGSVREARVIAVGPLATGNMG